MVSNVRHSRSYQTRIGHSRTANEPDRGGSRKREGAAMAQVETDDGRGLLAEQRRAAIAAEVRARGGVRVTDLVLRFGVSDMTVRRDLDALARDGLLEKVHGGAVALGESSAHEPGFEAKRTLETADKEAIAEAAAALVPRGGAVALSAGTTTFALARRLTDVSDLTVVTNSMRIAELFAQQIGRASCR